MILHFDQALVRQLLAHSQAAPARRAAFDQAEPAGPGLWLVGDSGVYLMSNGLPGLLREPGTSRQFVCRAIEADPDALGYERADDAKRASFGGDDGVEFIDAADLLAALAGYKPAEPLALDVTAESIGILLSNRPKRKAGAR
jgi:hypothetical protein